MKWYADSSGRRTFQIVADVFLLCFVAVCVWLGREVHDGVATLRAPAEGLTSAGDSFRDNMSGAADSVGNIPLVGDGLRTPFEALSGSGQRLADVGTSAAATVDTVARTLGIVVAVFPIVMALLVWAFFRIRFVRRASAASRLVGTEGSLELFALRALTRQPLRRLTPLGPDLARRFRNGDPAVVRQLAALELRSCGVALDDGEPSGRVPRLA
jgi:TRAP-type C4-dicarboxylate transport system permease small subunit